MPFPHAAGRLLALVTGAFLGSALPMAAVAQPPGPGGDPPAAAAASQAARPARRATLPRRPRARPFWAYRADAAEMDFLVEKALVLSPCRCDLEALAKAMGWYARARHDLDRVRRNIVAEIRDQYLELGRELAREAHRLQLEGKTKAAVSILKVAEALMVEAIDVFTDDLLTAAKPGLPLEKVSQVGGARTGARRLVEAGGKAARKEGGKVAKESVLSSLEEGDGEAPAQARPQARRIAELRRALRIWSDLGRDLARREEAAWKRLLASRPCRRLLGGALPVRATEERLPGKGLNAWQFGKRAPAAVEAACALGRTATQAGEGRRCEPRSALAALYQLYHLYRQTRTHEVSLARDIVQLQKNIAGLYRTTIGMYQRPDTDWLEFWTGAKGWSGIAEFVISFMPLGGPAVEAAHSLGTVVAQARYARVAREIQQEIDKARGWLSDTQRQMERLQRLADRIARCERDLWKRLLRCAADVPCEGKDLVPAGGRPGRIAGDSGEWCRYWGWVREYPGGGIVLPPEEEEEAPPRPPTEKGPPRPPTVPRPPTEKGPPRPPTVPRPPIHVKAKRRAFEEGAKAQAVAGFKLKLLAPAPALPLAGNARDDSGFDQPPVQATTGADGTAAFPAAGMGAAFPRDRRRRFALSFGDLIAEANAADGAGAVRPVEVTFDLPAFQSYTVRIRVDRSLPRWDDPASYLEPPFDGYVARHWLVGDVLYVVVNVPEMEGGAR